MGSMLRALVAACVVLACALPTTALAGDVLFRNVRVFDGKSASLSPPTSVLVSGNRIARIDANAEAPAGAQVIDGRGKKIGRAHV